MFATGLFLSFTLMALPNWPEHLKLEGDLLIRHRERLENRFDESKQEIGARLLAKFQPTPYLQMGFELRTASSHIDQRPEAIPMGNGFSNLQVSASQAYIATKFKLYDRWQAELAAGLFLQPLFVSELVWDPDRRSQGLYQSFSRKISPSQQLQFSFGQWKLDQGRFNESLMFIESIEWSYQSNFQIRPRLNLHAIQYRRLSPQVQNLNVTRGNSFSSPLNGNFQNSQNFLPLGSQLILESTQLGVDFGVRLAGLINFKSQKDERAWLAELMAGRSWTRNSARVRAAYFYQEPNAQIGILPDDRYAGSNRKGARFELSYFPSDQLRMGSEFILASVIEKSPLLSKRYELFFEMEYKI